MLAFPASCEVKHFKRPNALLPDRPLPPVKLNLETVLAVVEAEQIRALQLCLSVRALEGD
jgi:hypothetical protein